MFIALANERHFGRAAESLGITQPSLSAGIRQLEDQLGVQLVFRGSRFQGLTPEGQRVLDWARRIVGDIRTLREEMRAVRSGLSGNLRLGAIPTALPMVARLTAPFLARHPNVRMTILSRSSEEIREGIGNLDLDAGLTYLDNDPLGRVTVVPLYREGYCLLVHRDSPLAGRAGIGWAEAAAQPLCLLTPDMQNRRILNQHLAAAGSDPAPRVESNSSLALVAHVEAGGWASIVPRVLADTLARDGPVAAVPIDDPTARHRVGLVTAVREPHTPVVTALIEAAARFGPMG